jgi:hypothetical protein
MHMLVALQELADQSCISMKNMRLLGWTPGD